MQFSEINPGKEEKKTNALKKKKHREIDLCFYTRKQYIIIIDLESRVDFVTILRSSRRQVEIAVVRES